MRAAKLFFSWILCFTLFFTALVSFAGDEYTLRDGTRAVIVERHLILIRGDSRRSVARPGIYETMDGRTSIIVKGNGVVIREQMKELR
jgi:hypothetical protein